MRSRSDLHGYQEAIVRRIVEQPFCLAAVAMGLGKTVSTLTAVDELLRAGEVKRVLVVAPKRVAEHTWPGEVRQWAHLQHLRLRLIRGAPAKRLELAADDAQVHVITRDLLPWLAQAFAKRWRWDMVVFDESSGLKNHSTRRWAVMRAIRKVCKRLVLLSGTPTPNGAHELWPQAFLLDEGQRLGRTLGAFRQQYCEARHVTSTVVEYTVPPHRAPAVVDAVRDVMFSMRAEDYIELPPRIDNLVWTPDDGESWAEELKRSWVLSAPRITVDSGGVLVGKLLQIANGVVFDDDQRPVELHTAKLDALEEVLEGHERVLLFYAFTPDRDRIKRRWPHARELRTAADVDAWNAGRVELLLAHPASAGHGLNLQHAPGSAIAWFGLPYSLELYEQANARLHRQGRVEPVVIHHLVAAGSVDELVLQALRDKADVQQHVLKRLPAPALA